MQTETCRHLWAKRGHLEVFYSFLEGHRPPLGDHRRVTLMSVCLFYNILKTAHYFQIQHLQGICGGNQSHLPWSYRSNNGASYHKTSKPLHGHVQLSNKRIVAPESLLGIRFLHVLHGGHSKQWQIVNKPRERNVQDVKVGRTITATNHFSHHWFNEIFFG